MISICPILHRQRQHGIMKQIEIKISEWGNCSSNAICVLVTRCKRAFYNISDYNPLYKSTDNKNCFAKFI